MNSVRIRFMRWRIRDLHRLFESVQTKPTLYVVERDDGLFWAGPYRFQGYTFTNHDKMVYKFNNRQSALATAQGSGLDEPGHIATKGRIKISKAPA
jgi:hypothetical protein